ncbi:MAG: iron uptake system protein EfeO [Rhodospirillales bacterium 69-11]|nr:iron uptake system protein EfeO [Rhodospirillales bacterium]MBN8927010.1 iron uptake system protein EfeO [Rhodospirillales bacterium]OJW29559.1 MAG: iron uptake system protein EfeO [Rhodospirillales bacterium 69-11]
MLRLPAPALMLAALACPIVARAADPVAVTVTDKGCEPSSLTVPAGKTVFRIKNASKRALEWEILQGVMVVEERENILPGFTQTLTATLQAGDYQMTCGLLSNPKGTLTVSAGSGAASAPAALELVGPIAEYKLYVSKEVDALAAETAKFVDAVKAGKLEEAQHLYAPTRQHYERVEPIAELFNDLDGAIDARADDFEKKEDDPTWTGFHRLEKGLFADKSTDGLAPVADKLMADVTTLQERVAKLPIPPKAMVGGAAALIEEVAATKISGEEERYSRTDLWDFQANVDGAQKIVSLLRPLIAPRDPALLAKIDANFAKVDKLLAKYHGKEGFLSYDKVSTADRNAMKGPITQLAEDLSKLRGVLGVD